MKIPSIIALINKAIDELNAELDRIGRPIAVDSGVRTLINAENNLLAFETSRILLLLSSVSFI